MIKFVEIIINPYNKVIEHVIETGTPFEHPIALELDALPMIPIVVPPATPQPQLPYITKRFTVNCDPSINAMDLRESLEDTNPNSPVALPGVKTNAVKGPLITNVVDYATGRAAFNVARVAAGRKPL